MVKGIGGGLLFLIAALLVVGVFGLLRSNLEAQIEGEVWLPLPENFKGLVVDGDRAYFVQARTLPNGGVRVTVGGVAPLCGHPQHRLGGRLVARQERSRPRSRRLPRPWRQPTNRPFRAGGEVGGGATAPTNSPRPQSLA